MSTVKMIRTSDKKAADVHKDEVEAMKATGWQEVKATTAPSQSKARSTKRTGGQNE